MKLKQIAGFHLLDDDVCRNIEVTQFSDLFVAQRFVQGKFPNHVVSRTGERIYVANKDRSFTFVSFIPL